MVDNIGKRCEFTGYFGTVRYFGDVKTTSGLWYGIEWDEQRGKHNGSFKGEIYFSCREGHGSFVRPHKVNFGINISEAIERRYGDLSDDVDEENMYLVGEKNQRTLVDVVGFDQVKKALKQLKNLQKISLELMCVNGVGFAKNFESIGDKIPNVRDLDLSRNLFTLWSDVAVIARELKRLQLLNISGNRLADFNGDVKSIPVITSLTTIFLNRMSLEWSQIINMLHCLPNLVELHACFNGIQRLDIKESNSTGSALNSIRLLNLEGNDLDWNEIAKLSTLNSLETLIINNNRISKIHFSKKDVGFQSLKAISLSFNQISEWLSVNQLAHLTSLTSIKFKSNPLCKGESSFDIRYEIIARLAQINKMNCSEISGKERTDAELMYMKKYTSAWRDHGGNEAQTDITLSQEFLQAHPRFIHLIQCYGPPIASIKKATTLKDNLISLYFQCPSLDESKTISKKVPISMTIQQLRNLVQRLFKVNISEQRLYIKDTKTKQEIEMEDTLKDLTFYSINNNDIVVLRY